MVLAECAQRAVGMVEVAVPSLEQLSFSTAETQARAVPWKPKIAHLLPWQPANADPPDQMLPLSPSTSWLEEDQTALALDIELLVYHKSCCARPVAKVHMLQTHNHATHSLSLVGLLWLSNNISAQKESICSDFGDGN